MRSTGSWEWIWSAIESMASTCGVSGSWMTVLVVVGIVGCIGSGRCVFRTKCCVEIIFCWLVLEGL